MTSLNSTAVTVSWNALITSNISVDYYTVVYSQMIPNDSCQREEKHAMFTSLTTSGVITNLHAGEVYTFQVFATVTVDGRRLKGERSSPINFISE